MSLHTSEPATWQALEAVMSWPTVVRPLTVLPAYTLIVFKTMVPSSTIAATPRFPLIAKEPVLASPLHTTESEMTASPDVNVVGPADYSVHVTVPDMLA